MIVQHRNLGFQVAHIVKGNLNLLSQVYTRLVPQVLGNVHLIVGAANSGSVGATTVKVHAQLNANPAVCL